MPHRRCCWAAAVLALPRPAVGAHALEDARALLQTSVETDSRLYAEAFQRSKLGALAFQGSRSAGRFDCMVRPSLCKPPFNCHIDDNRKTLTTEEGHPDWHSWCQMPPYAEAALKCYNGDLPGYAKTTHLTQLGIPIVGRAVEILDAHYCFGFGHCDNTEVTPNTTLQESEAMCDRKFGGHWRNATTEDPGIKINWITPGLYGVHFNAKQEAAFAEISCAMGNYHCDVIYCRQEFCRDPRFVAMYSKITPAYKQMQAELKAKRAREQSELKAQKAQRAKVQSDLKAQRAKVQSDLKAERAKEQSELKAQRAKAQSELKAQRAKELSELKAQRAKEAQMRSAQRAARRGPAKASGRLQAETNSSGRSPS